MSHADEYVSLLKGKVGFILKRRNADGTWKKAEADRAGGNIVFEAGDQIAMEIVEALRPSSLLQLLTKQTLAV